MNENEIVSMQPIGNNLLMRLSARKTESRGGIVLPQNMKLSVWHSGTVVKLGPGKRRQSDGERIPSQLEVGKKGVFRSFSDGWELFKADDTGAEFLVMPEDLVEFCVPGTETL